MQSILIRQLSLQPISGQSSYRNRFANADFSLRSKQNHFVILQKRTIGVCYRKFLASLETKLFHNFAMPLTTILLYINYIFIKQKVRVLTRTFCVETAFYLVNIIMVKNTAATIHVPILIFFIFPINMLITIWAIMPKASP